MGPPGAAAIEQGPKERTPPGPPSAATRGPLRSATKL
jgi:hypothetical protein